MIRTLMITAALLAPAAATAAQAQTAGGPPIAYVKRASNGDEIHLVSADGAERRRVYKAKSKVQITMLDLRPGGGEVAFLEGYYTLKILAYDSEGPLNGNPREIIRVSSPCTVEAPDYHPTNGTLLFVEGCGRDRAVRIVQSGGASPDPVPIFEDVAVFRARWSRLGDVIYWVGLLPGAQSSDPAYLHRRNADSSTDQLGPIIDWQSFDVGRVGDKIFFGGNNRFSVLDFAAGSTTADAQLLACPLGTRMTPSPDDEQMVFQSPWARGKGNYVLVGPASVSAGPCETDPVRVSEQGNWGPTDWRTEGTAPFGP